MPPLRLFTAFVVLSGIPVDTFGQQPSINPDGVVNAASLIPRFAPGSIVAILGESLSPVTECVNALPLPFEMAGVRVTFNDIPAPLFSVSPDRIVVQAPSNLVNPGDFMPKRVLVRVSSGQGSTQAEAFVLVMSPGIFTANSSGCGVPVAINSPPDGSTQWHGPENSLQPGDWVRVYFTGLGRLPNMGEDGYPAGTTPFREGPYGVELAGRGRTVRTSYRGRTPGSVGLDEITFALPEGVPEGCAIPLRIPSTYGDSQPVSLSIRSGRGECQPDPKSLALVEWKHRVFNSGAAADSVLVRLNRSEWNAFPDLIQAGQRRALDTTPTGPDCPIFIPEPLDAGALLLEPANADPFEAGSPATPPGESVRTLPAGAVGPGRYSIRTGGGPDVGEFSSEVTIPEPIQVTTPLSPGTVMSCYQDLTVRWTGGDDKSVVRVLIRRKIAPPYLEGDRLWWGDEAASKGELTFRAVFVGPGLSPTGVQLPVCTGGRNEVTIVVTQMPREDLVTPFAAEGLTLGGRHLWSYEFRFEKVVLGGTP